MPTVAAPAAEEEEDDGNIVPEGFFDDKKKDEEMRVKRDFTYAHSHAYTRALAHFRTRGR